MLKAINILKLSKMLLMLLAVVFMLSACNANDNDNTDQGPLNTGETGQTAADDETLSQQNRSCWQSQIVDVLYSQMGSVTFTVYRQITGGAMEMMMIAFAVWMSVRLLRHVSSLKEETMGETWQEIARMFFLCFVCGFIASRPQMLIWVLNDVIFPIYNAFLEFASALLQAIGDSSAQSITVNGATESYSQPVLCKAGELTSITADSTAFPESPRNMMRCMICALNERLTFGATMAFKTLRGTNFTAYVIAFIVLICFTFVKIGFAFYLIDTIFKFTIMMVMLPVTIMGYPFKQTRGLLSEAVKNILNSAGFMMMIAIVLIVCVSAISVLLTKYNTYFTGGKVGFQDFSVAFLSMLMVCFMVISSVKVAGQLTDKLIGGSSNSEFQKSAKAIIGGAVEIARTGGMAIAARLMPKPLKDAAKNVSQSISNGINKMK